MARYNPDGSLDANFGVGGKVLTDFGGGADSAAAMAIQNSNGRIVVAGSSGLSFGRGFAVARYHGFDCDGLSLSLAPGIVTAVAGGNTGSLVAIIREAGFTCPITLQLASPVDGVTGSFSPTTATGPGSNLTINVDRNVPAGHYILHVNGSNGTPTSLIASATMALIVNPFAP